VYRSDVIAREHAALAEGYLGALRQLTMRFLGLRSAAALIQGLGFALALTAAYALLTGGGLNLVNIAVIIPGLSFLFGMTQSLIYQVRTLLESLRYADALFEFLATERFDGASDATTVLAPLDSAPAFPRLAAICLEDVSYVYPENAKLALADLSCEFTPGL